MTDPPNLPEYPKVLVDGKAVVIHYENGSKEVWGYDPNDDIETIRVHIRHLRTKLEPDPRHPKYIKTVYGAGYCLELPQGSELLESRAS